MNRLALIRVLSVAVGTTAIGAGTLGYLGHLEAQASPASLITSVFAWREATPGVWASRDPLGGDRLVPGDEVRLYLRADETTWVDVSTVDPSGESHPLHRTVVDGATVWPAPGDPPLRMGSEAVTLVVRARSANREPVPELEDPNAAAHGALYLMKDDIMTRDPAGAPSGFTGQAVEGEGGWLVWRHTFEVDLARADAPVPTASALVARPGGPRGTP